MVTPQSQNVHKLPQKRLVSSHQTVGRWFIFMHFVLRIFWWNRLAINRLLVFVSRWKSWLEPFRFHVNCFHFVKAEPALIRCIRSNCIGSSASGNPRH